MHRIFVIIIAAVMVANPVIWVGLNLTGFCWEQKRWLSDEERIDNAIYAIIVQYKIGYTVLDDFKANNPNCCKIGDNDTFGVGKWSPHTLFTRIAGKGIDKNIISIHYGNCQPGNTQKQCLEERMQAGLPDGGRFLIGSKNCGGTWGTLYVESGWR